MKKVDIKHLLEKYKAGTATPEELQLLENWYLQWKPDEVKVEHERLEQLKKEVWQILLSRSNKVRKIHRWLRVAAAAAVIIGLSAGVYFLLQTPDQPAPLAQILHDVEPGGNKAILTLADGNQIILTDAQNGKLAEQDLTEIKKTTDGEIVYDISKVASASPPLSNKLSYNTVTTPRAGQYKVVLPDSSIAFLDAFSSIRFPTAFKKEKREVTTTGQVYFEVAHDEYKPFIVKTKGQRVQVLGTHFNINAYDDEALIKTTLLEGSVQISALGSLSGSVILNPGQQAVMDTKGNIKVAEVSTGEFTAWKDGYFRFNNAGLPAIMRQFARWYDVEVVYEGQSFPQQFNGKIKRDANLSRVLRILDLGGVEFRLESLSADKADNSAEQPKKKLIVIGK